jgi:hypothetical protein
MRIAKICTASSGLPLPMLATRLTMPRPEYSELLSILVGMAVAMLMASVWL